MNLRLAGNPILSVIHIQENQILVSCNYIRIIRILGQPHKHTQLCLCIASFHFWIGFIQLPFAEEQVLEFINGTFGEIDIFLRNLVVLGNRVFNRLHQIGAFHLKSHVRCGRCISQTQIRTHIGQDHGRCQQE